MWESTRLIKLLKVAAIYFSQSSLRITNHKSLQDAGHTQAGRVWEIGEEVVHFAAIGIALLDVLLGPGQPGDLAANVRAPNVAGDGRLRLVGVVQADKGDSSARGRIHEDLPEHARNGHLLGRSTDAQVEVHGVVVDVGEGGAALGKINQEY